MGQDRWYYLRHAEGFSPDLFACVRSGWETWRSHVEATIRHWAHVGVGKAPPPTYEWFEPELSEDRTVVTIPLGGAGTYGSYHLLEERIPTEFARYLPVWFQVSLELGRKDEAGWFPEVAWQWVVEPKDRDAYSRVYPRPSD